MKSGGFYLIDVRKSRQAVTVWRQRGRKVVFLFCFSSSLLSWGCKEAKIESDRQQTQCNFIHFFLFLFLFFMCAAPSVLWWLAPVFAEPRLLWGQLANKIVLATSSFGAATCASVCFAVQRWYWRLRTLSSPAFEYTAEVFELWGGRVDLTLSKDINYDFTNKRP